MKDRGSGGIEQMEVRRAADMVYKNEELTLTSLSINLVCNLIPSGSC